MTGSVEACAGDVLTFICVDTLAVLIMESLRTYTIVASLIKFNKIKFNYTNEYFYISRLCPAKPPFF